jgi:hypothetical protein
MSTCSKDRSVFVFFHLKSQTAETATSPDRVSTASPARAPEKEVPANYL